MAKTNFCKSQYFAVAGSTGFFLTLCQMQGFHGPFQDCFTISSTRNLVHPARVDQIYKKNQLPDPTYQDKRLKTAKTAPQFDGIS